MNAAISIFADLEPLAGAVLAICLGYLALPNLRYRDQVNRLARKVLRRLDRRSEDEGLHENNSYWRIVRFSEDFASDNHKALLTKKQENGEGIPASEDQGPSHWVFGIRKQTSTTPLDTKIICSITAFSLCIFCAGVIESAAMFGLIGIIKSIPSWVTSLCGIILFLAILAPAIFVWAGRKRVTWAREKIEYLENDCLKNIRASNINKKIPKRPPNATDNEKEELRAMVKDVARELLSETRNKQAN